MHDQQDILFKETQRFTQWWVWLFIMGMLALPIYGIVQQIILKEPWGNNPMSDLGLFVFLLVMIGFVYFFYAITLKTWIHPKGIVVSFFPFFKKKQFQFKDIVSATVVSYRFVGGYGLRYSTKYGTIYNIKGNKGLALTMKNGKKFMIGTQHSVQVAELVKHQLARSVTKNQI